MVFFSREDALLRVDTQRERLSGQANPPELARIHLLSQLHDHLLSKPELSEVDRQLVDLVLLDQAEGSYEVTCAGMPVLVSRASVGRAYDLVRIMRDQGMSVPSILLDYERAVAIESPTSRGEQSELQRSIEALLHRSRVLLTKKQQPEMAALVDQLQKMLEVLADRQSPVRMGMARAMRVAVVNGSELVRQTERVFAEQRPDSPVPMDERQSGSTQRIAEQIQEETRSALTSISKAAHDDVQRRRQMSKREAPAAKDRQVNLPLTKSPRSGAARFVLPALPAGVGAVVGSWVFAQAPQWAGLSDLEMGALGGGVLATVAVAVSNLLLRAHLRAGEHRALRQVATSLHTSELLIDRAVHALDGAPQPPAPPHDYVEKIQSWILQVPADTAHQLRDLMQEAEVLLVHGGTQFLVGVHRAEWDSLIDDLLPASIEKYLALRSATGGASVQVQDSLHQQLYMINQAATRLAQISIETAAAEMKAHESFLAQKLGHSDLKVD